MEDQNPRYSKRLRTGTRRRYQDDGISDDEIEGKRTFDLDEKLQSDRFNSYLVKHMDGKDFTFEYIQREGLRDPIVFEKKDGLGLEMPDSDFSVSDVKLFVGSRRMVDVMDVTTQKGIEMSMAQWRRYYETPPSERDKLYNVISLEFSHTKLENLVKRPASVDLIDWVDNMWPRHLKERQRDSTNSIIEMQYPKVQKYCLMSVQGCFTDFHVDFGGTSVWYHILRGGKVFWLIPPTPQNLELYENWVLSGKQGDIFLGDKAQDCQRIELKQGYTFMIPSGWIHAVYTPEDTLVFGGNFLHSFNIPMQLNIYNIEDRTRVPAKFRYPFYYEMCWYVLERYLYCLTNTSHLTPDFQKHSLGVDSENKLNGHVKNGTEEKKEGDDDKEEKEEESETKVQMEESDDDSFPLPGVTKPGVRVNLTPLELEGLWNLLGKLEELPTHKKCVPAGIRNAPALLHDIRALLEEHCNDDPKLSYTGKPIVKWPKRVSVIHLLTRVKVSTTQRQTNFPAVVPRPAKPTSISALRRRRVRCKHCAACQRKECGECNFCKDMRRFGGPGRMKKGCMMRQCLAPGLPNSAVCALCGAGQGKQECSDESPSSTTLMECSNCAQIAHPDCIKVPGEGRINKDLPSCWECPKCYQGKEGSSSEVPQFFLFLSISQGVLSPPLPCWQTVPGPWVLQRLPLPLPYRGSPSAPPTLHQPGPCRQGRGEQGAREWERSTAQRRSSRERKKRTETRRSRGRDDELMKGSYLTVTLQPSRAKRDPGAIVPKLEAAVAPRPNLARPPLRNHAPDPYAAPSHSDTHTRGSHPDERRMRPGRAERTDNSASSSSPVPPLRLPLSALQDGGREVANGGSEPGCEREVWVSVFRYLTRAELCVCMAVCKNWHKWSLDKRLWMRVDLSVSKSISPQALSGIIKRQPVTLDLSWTSISKKQLTWLINRLPGLKDLMLSGCSWSSISALSSPGCPLLRTLDLRWADGIKDGQIRDLLNPPGCDNRSQLRNMQSFRLAGLEISDSTLRLVIRHMPLLTRLDLSHCGALTDQSINLLTAVGSSTRNTLTELNLGGCSKLTDSCLRYLRRLSCLSLLDLRECKSVSRKACEAFISELSVNTLYCLSEDKLIQRIS
uniref:[histone H3]-dimethyl-L-lysine(36) demethylase n=1 Tax=Oncorhynchus tshawytscha TaxID=74940 RepID=A0A8C8ETI2_ONCTS